MGKRTAGLGLALLIGLLLIVPSASAAGLAKGHAKRVCANVTGKRARCHAEVEADAGGKPLATPSYQSGYNPSDLQSAYGLAAAAASAGGTQTVAIVDAYDAPNAEADLGVYRSQFNLGDCTTANGCFKKVNQSGSASPLPPPDAGWAQEISLDLDMVSAICPKCKILLVEGTSASFADLAAAVDRAAAMGATQISNSYGGSEFFSSSYASHYNHPGIDITASSGDSGYSDLGADFPASTPYVTAVGGTHLVHSSNARGWFESVWSGAGSGCSLVYAKPSWQTDSGCSDRSVADVAAVADPATGVAVYDSYPNNGESGWFVFGGTSVASPIIAAVDALAGGRSPGTSYGRYAYDHQSEFFDITGGSNGSCAQTYLCTGVGGYDGPTGMGTPNSVTVPVAPSPPSPTGKPVISDTSPTEGQTLTTTNGTWDNNPTFFTYLWQCGGGACGSTATNSSYVVAHGDVGKTIQVTVTGHNTAGQADNTSDPTAAVEAIPADFSISVSPTSRSIRRGQSTTYTVTVTPNSSFSGSVDLTATGGPAGTTRSFNPTSTSSSSTLTVTTSASATQGTYTLTITGTSGALTHSTSATVTVRRK